MQDEIHSGNVYLLPHTIDYYQRELTRLLELERYEEAANLLRFLMGCKGEQAPKEEWQALLDWLITIFPETGRLPEDAEEEASEEEILRSHLMEKAEKDPSYVSRLLSVFRQSDAAEKQFLALEQLRYLDHPNIDQVLLEWLDGRILPPSLQFKAMQILKRRGAAGMVRLYKNGETFVENLAEVPAATEEFPLPFREILDRVLRVSGRNDPIIVPFAEQTWEEFMAYAYGTDIYRSILIEPPEAWDAWAGAFHSMLMMTAHGTAAEDEIREWYGYKDSLKQSWKKAGEVFREFARRIFPAITGGNHQDSE